MHQLRAQAKYPNGLRFSCEPAPQQFAESSPISSPSGGPEQPVAYVHESGSPTSIRIGAIPSGGDDLPQDQQCSQCCQMGPLSQPSSHGRTPPIIPLLSVMGRRAVSYYPGLAGGAIPGLERHRRCRAEPPVALDKGPMSNPTGRPAR